MRRQDEDIFRSFRLEGLYGRAAIAGVLVEPSLSDPNLAIFPRFERLPKEFGLRKRTQSMDAEEAGLSSAKEDHVATEPLEEGSDARQIAEESVKTQGQTTESLQAPEWPESM